MQQTLATLHNQYQRIGKGLLERDISIQLKVKVKFASKKSNAISP
jgi:hypothetical protein